MPIVSSYIPTGGATATRNTDVLPFPFRLPDDVREGDWLEIDQIGAYGSALRTQFNGFYPDTFIEITEGAPARLAAEG